MDGVIEAETTEPVTPDADTSAQDARDLAAAQDEWKLSDAAYSEQRTNELADLEFEAGKHWSDADLAWRKQKNKPAFVMDQTSGQVAKVTNQPVHRIIVSPNGGGADPKSAEYWQGYARRVENLSGAEDVYKWGRRHATVMGRGFWRVRPDYFNRIELRPDGKYDPNVFLQDLRVEAILNQHSVHPDPRCRMLDYSDQRFCILTDDLHWTEFGRLYPNAKHKDLTSVHRTLGSVANCPPQWASEKTIRVAERYYIEDVTVTLCALRSGQVVAKDGKTTYPKEQIVREHTFRIPKVKWMKYTAAEVLERADVPGRYIPIVRINGERRIIDGKEDARGMVRMAKGPQQLVDFMESRLAETVDLAAYDTWKAPAEAVEGYADDYVNAHIDRPGLLLYNHKDSENAPLPEPEHVSVAPNIAGIAVAAQRASMTLRSVLGVPDVTPDELRPEQSGRAIRARQQEQAQTTSHYGDSTAAGIRHTGRIILSMAREILDVPRILRIVGKDEKEIDLVTYKGKDQQDAAQQLAAQPGHAAQTREQMRHMLDISLGDFDVTVSAGKGYQSGREETVDVIQNVLPLLPPPMAMKAVPIMVKNIDAPGMQELASSLSPDEEGQTVPIEEAQKAQMVIDRLTEVVQQLQQQLEAKTAELKSKEAIAAAKNETDKQIADMKAQIDAMKIALDFEKAQMQARQAEQARQDGTQARREGFAHERARAAEEHARQPQETETGA